jgi:hypothetical protein
MLERGRRDPHPTIFSRIQVGVIGGRTSKGAGSSALLHDRLVCDERIGLLTRCDTNHVVHTPTWSLYMFPLITSNL